MGIEAENKEEELPLPWVPWDSAGEPETVLEVNHEEELPLPWVPWDEPEVVNPELEPMPEDQTDENTNTSITKDITEINTTNVAAEVAEDIINSDQPDEKWWKAEEMPPNWFVIEHIPCPGENYHFAEYVRGSDDMWYFRLAGPEYRPLDARELRWFLSWRHDARPINTIVELEEDEFF